MPISHLDQQTIHILVEILTDSKTHNQLLPYSLRTFHNHKRPSKRTFLLTNAPALSETLHFSLPPLLSPEMFFPPHMFSRVPRKNPPRL